MDDKIITELIKYGEISGMKSYTPGISGNISARDGDNIIITSSGSANGFLTKKDFSLIDFGGNLLEGNPKPSSERFLHIEYYKKRPDINCVFHFHSPFLTAFAASGKSLDEKISPEIIYCFGEIPIARYALPGTDELVRAVSVFFGGYDIILMENHGVIAGGSSIKQTYLNLELAEEYAKTILFTKLLGGAKILSSKEVEKIYSLK